MARTKTEAPIGLLSVPNLYPGQTPELVESMNGPERAAKVLRVAPELLAGWMTGAIEAPRTALLAMYWQGNYGFNTAFSESHWTHQYNSMLKNEARARVEALESFIVANGMQPPPGQLTTHKEMLLAGPLPEASYRIRELAGQPSFALASTPSAAPNRA